MVILRIMVWTLLFAMTTLGWVVVFEHGLSDFPAGWGEEWRNFKNFLGSGDQAAGS